MLLSAIGQTLGLDVLPIGEASLSELRVRPDYAIVLSTSPIPVGYLDVKAPGKGADTSAYRGHDKKQWERCSPLPNLLYTDGNEWALYRRGERVGNLVAFEGDIRESGEALRSDGPGKARWHSMSGC